MKNARVSGALVGETVIDFLRGAVERYGSRDALLFKPAFRYQRWSYSRLWNESGQVATLLQRRGLTMGDQVILWGPNSPHWVLIFFGCIRAGVVLVPWTFAARPTTFPGSYPGQNRNWRSRRGSLRRTRLTWGSPKLPSRSWKPPSKVCPSRSMWTSRRTISPRSCSPPARRATQRASCLPTET